ncbi:MAG: stage III sporulation protein AA, partial [Planifilum fulgidum]
MIDRVLRVLPLSIRNLLESLSPVERSRLEEIRVRQDRPLEVITTEKSRFVTPEGRLTRDPREAYRPSGEDCRKMLNLISNHSLYALEEELRRGYVTIEGGHRIGLSGKVVVEGGRVRHLRDITGFNVRIARQIPGVAGGLIPYLFQGGRVENVLIVSPPQCGKTTLLRDLARIASTGEKGLSPLKVGIVDERSELAGCVQG